MDHKEIVKLTKERLSNIKNVSSRLNKYKQKIEEAKILESDKEYKDKLNSEIKKYELELCHIRNAMEPLKEVEKKIIALNLFEGVIIKNVAVQVGLTDKYVNKIKTKAIETIADILYN